MYDSPIHANQDTVGAMLPKLGEFDKMLMFPLLILSCYAVGGFLPSSVTLFCILTFGMLKQTKEISELIRILYDFCYEYHGLGLFIWLT